MTHEQYTDAPHNHNLLDSPVGKSIAAAVIATEVSPLNEIFRGAITVGAGVISRDPIVTAGVFAAATAAIEGGAALVTAEALDSEYGKNVIAKVNDKLRSSKVGKHVNTNTPTDFGISLFAGTTVAMLVKQSQDPERTKAENKSFGLKMTAATSTLLGGAAFVTAEGIANPSIESVGATAIALGGIGTFIGWARRKAAK